MKMKTKLEEIETKQSRSRMNTADNKNKEKQIINRRVKCSITVNIQFEFIRFSNRYQSVEILFDVIWSINLIFIDLRLNNPQKNENVM